MTESRRPRVLLLENVHPDVELALQQFGEVEIERWEGSPDRGALCSTIGEFDVLGIRSRTRVDQELLEHAGRLRTVGCFCIGTNQVDLDLAAHRGIPVFNAPFANTRSVAELTLASVVMLMRGIPRKMQAIRRGEWLKTAIDSHEVRGKKLGIVGYGNIGSQLSVLASGHGMHVYYFDIEPKLAHGNARVVSSLSELLELADVISLHVPSTERTRGLFDAAAIAQMRKGSFLINHARGDLVDIDALAQALRSGHLAGAAIDVFPEEPKSAEDVFNSPLLEFDNVLLTPHIGGSTVEAQAAIGRDAAYKLARFLFEGATVHAVNFPQVEPGTLAVGSQRLGCVHYNAPGYLSRLNEAVSGAGGNVTSQHLQTMGDIGYAVADVEGELTADLASAISSLEGTIRASLLPAGR